jgi:hypothetical protein
LVWETAKISGTDSLLQGLFGRMCGYPYHFGDMKPLIILPKTSMKDLQRYVDGLVPLKSRNVVGVHHEHDIEASKTSGRYQCPPIRLTPVLGGHMLFRKNSHSELRTEGSVYFDIGTRERTFLETQIDSATFLTTSQKEEIKTRMTQFRYSPDRISIRRLQNGSQDIYFQDLLRAERENTTTIEHITNYPYFTIVVMVDDTSYKHIPEEKHFGGFKTGDAWLVCYTHSPSDESVQYKGPFTGKENGLSHFGIHPLLDEPTTDAVPGGPIGLHGFLPDAYTDASAFERQLGTMIRAWKYKECMMIPVLRDLTKEYKFSSSAFEFVDSKTNAMLAILKRLELEYDCTIDITFTRGRIPKGHFNVQKISWH